MLNTEELIDVALLSRWSLCAGCIAIGIKSSIYGGFSFSVVSVIVAHMKATIFFYFAF